MDELRLEPGTVLANKYRLESVLGTGGMGTVYQAEHLALKALVAVKVIDREVAEGDVALARFMREAQSAASLRSPHVVQILDYGMEGKRPFMVMEMLEGEPLAARIRRLGRLSPAETFRVISHIARAVSKAHEADIIHRDLKPDNVFLVHNEGDEIAKVLDFGVAKVEATQLDGEGHTRTGSLLGTPYYMSPEQAQGNKDIDARSDLWALGVIAFECLTGKRPFSSDGLGDLVIQICIRDIPVPSQVVPVPPGFDDWFKKACERDPELRFQTARDLAESLRHALDLGSEAGGSVPESKLVQAAAFGAVPSALSAAPTLSSELAFADSQATRTPPSGTPSLGDLRPTNMDPGARTPSDPGVRPNDPQWKVVPHDEDGARALPDAERQSGGGTSVAFVAIIALLLGGTIVFGVRQVGVEIPGFGKKPKAPITVRERPNIRGTVGSEATESDTEENPESKDAQSKKPVLDENTPEGELKDPSQGTEGGEKKDDASKETPEGESLDAIDEAAEKTLKERDEAAEKEKKAKEKSTTETPPKDEGSGPQPKLPDSLAPAPTPPPPPN